MADISYEIVLDYWFGGDLTTNYKQKWFPSGADDLQHQTDAEIFNIFKAYLDKAVSGELSSWADLNYRSILALIIVCDQFSRHIYRYENIPKDDTLRLQADSIALNLTDKILQNSAWSTYYHAHEIIFILMPYRHTPTIARLKIVMQYIDEKESYDIISIELLNKFRKQTMTRLQHMEDRAKAEATDDILERIEVDIEDDSSIQYNKLTQATLQFLTQYWLPTGSTSSSSNTSQSTTGNTCVSLGNDCNVENKAIEVIHDDSGNKESISTSSTPPVIISLSGGVDSMVITRILVYLKKYQLLPIQTIIAIHIDYANRPESSQEASYLESYCSKHLITFHKRIVHEVTRGITDRTIYEKIAREIRYTYYQEILGTYGGKGVIFGHHIGDVQENVISNVMRGSSPLDLSGMTAVGVVNHVNVWRPLLAYTKDDIYTFAHKYGVPYFKDTTPTWSTRGKLRNHLIPLLIDMYGVGCLHNLSLLAGASDELRQMVHTNIYDPLLKKTQYYPCGLKLNVIGYETQPIHYWKEILKILMHSLGMSLVREGAVMNFLDRLNPSLQLYKKKNIHESTTTPTITTTTSTAPITMKSSMKKREKNNDEWEQKRLDIEKYKAMKNNNNTNDMSSNTNTTTTKNDNKKENKIDKFIPKEIQSSSSSSSCSSSLNIIDGWIELRKGFHCYLTRQGDLIIYKDHVLCLINTTSNNNNNNNNSVTTTAVSREDDERRQVSVDRNKERKAKSTTTSTTNTTTIINKSSKQDKRDKKKLKKELKQFIQKSENSAVTTNVDTNDGIILGINTISGDENDDENLIIDLETMMMQSSASTVDNILTITPPTSTTTATTPATATTTPATATTTTTTATTPATTTIIQHESTTVINKNINVNAYQNIHNNVNDMEVSTGHISLESNNRKKDMIPDIFSLLITSNIIANPIIIQLLHWKIAIQSIDPTLLQTSGVHVCPTTLLSAPSDLLSGTFTYCIPINDISQYKAIYLMTYAEYKHYCINTRQFIHILSQSMRNTSYILAKYQHSSSNGSSAIHKDEYNNSSNSNTNSSINNDNYNYGNTVNVPYNISIEEDDEIESISLPYINNIDMKFRLLLPLLVPIGVCNNDSNSTCDCFNDKNDNDKNNDGLHLYITYEYIPA